MGILSGLLGLFGSNGQTKPTGVNISKVTFQEQLETFKQLGFNFNRGTDTSDINRWPGGYKEFEDQPYHLMYQTLGQTIERAP